MSWIDRLFVGEVIRDFGLIKRETKGIARISHSALLVKESGKLRFVIKESAWAILGASVSYMKFDLEDAYKIRNCINESEAINRNSPSAYLLTAAGVGKPLPFSSVVMVVVIFMVGTLIIWWLDQVIMVLIAMLFLFVALINNHQDFQTFEQTTSWQKYLSAFLAAAALIIGFIRTLTLLLS